MKKQLDLKLIIPDKYNEYYSILHSKKSATNKHNPKTVTSNEVYPPLSTEYETININNYSPKNRINIKKTFFSKRLPLPLITRQGLFYSTNKLLTQNKKSLEGFKPIEDNKIRNKFKLKDINSPLSIKYISLNEKTNQFDKYVISLLKKNKFKNFNVRNQRYATDNNNYDDFFNKNIRLKQKLNILNRFLNKTYERHKKQFKRYYKDKEDYLKELLTIEILNKTSKLKLMDNIQKINTSNRLYTHFSPNPFKISLKSSIFNNKMISYKTSKKLKNTIINKCSACYRNKILAENKNKEEKEIQIEAKRDKEEEKELIIHNVFFEWVMDNVLMKIDNNGFLNYYYSLFKNNRLLSAQKSIKNLLNKEIKILSNYLFKNNNTNLNNSFDSLIKSIRPISNEIIKLRNKSKKPDKINKKKVKSADLAKTNYKIDNMFENSISSINNDYDDIDIKQNILNKLIDKINNNNGIDNLDMKNNSNKKVKKLNVLISCKKNMRDDNDLSVSLNNKSNSNSNTIDISKDIKSFDNLSRKTPKEIKIEERIKNNLNKNKFPEINNKNYMKMYISKYYSKNYQQFFEKLYKIKTNDSETNNNNSIESEISEKSEVTVSNKNDKNILPLISNVHQNKIKDINTIKNEILNIGNNKSEDKEKNKSYVNKIENRRRLSVVLIFSPQLISSQKEENAIMEKTSINENSKVNSKSINKNNSFSNIRKEKDKKEEENKNIIKTINNKKGNQKNNTAEKINKEKTKQNEIISKNKPKNEDIENIFNNIQKINNAPDKSKDRKDMNENKKNDIKEIQKEKNKNEINDINKDKESIKKIEKDKNKEKENIKKLNEKNLQKETKKINNNVKEIIKEKDKNSILSPNKNEIKGVKKNNDLKDKEGKKEEKIKKEVEKDLKKDKNKVNNRVKIESKEKEQKKEDKKDDKKEGKNEIKKEGKNEITKESKKEKEKVEKKEVEKEEKIEYEIEEKKDNKKKMDKNDKKIEKNEENENLKTNQKEKIKKKKSNKNLDLENNLFTEEKPIKGKKSKEKKKPKKSSKTKDKSLPKDPESTQPSESKTEKKLEFIPIKKKKSKYLKKLSIKKSLINLINKQKEKHKDVNNNTSMEKDQSQDDIDYEDKQNLIAFAEQLHKLNELKDENKTEDLIQQEKDIKEKYKEIIIKYLYKQKQKELVKKKEKFSYEKSKIKIQYNDKNEVEDDTETELILKMNDEEKESIQKELSILLEDEENELDDNLNGMVKLIYDNSYLFQHKKKDIPIRPEVLNILNESKNFENNINGKTTEENQESNSKNASKNNLENNSMKNSSTSILKINKNQSNSSLKYFKKRKIIKSKYKDNDNKRLSLFNDALDIKEEKKQENEELQNSDEEFEKRLNIFFTRIQNLKNNVNNSDDLDQLMNEEFKDLETDRKQISRRLNDFIENRDNYRDYDRSLKPRFNFLSPIKFSVKDVLE